MAGRTSSGGHAHIPEACLDRRLGPAELTLRADVKKEGGNLETVCGVLSLPSTSVSHLWWEKFLHGAKNIKIQILAGVY